MLRKKNKEAPTQVSHAGGAQGLSAGDAGGDQQPTPGGKQPNLDKETRCAAPIEEATTSLLENNDLLNVFREQIGGERRDCWSALLDTCFCAKSSGPIQRHSDQGLFSHPTAG